MGGNMHNVLRCSSKAVLRQQKLTSARQARHLQMSHSTVQCSVNASYYRGGTSRAVIFKETELPQNAELRRQIFLQVIGAPDIHGRQLNGLGAGISSLSKVCIISQDQTHSDVDVLYTFAGIGIERDEVDYSGNCGNMASAVGPYAFNQRLLEKQFQQNSQLYEQDGEVVVNFVNTNTDTMIRSRFRVRAGQAQVDDETVVDGVSGLGTGIQLDFIHPGGSKTQSMLPTGKVVDTLIGYEASCVDSGNPCVFVRAADLNVDPTILPKQLNDALEITDKLEEIRTAGAVAMGIIKSGEPAPRVIPKIALVAPAQDQRILSGRTTPKQDLDLVVRFISDTQPHRAIPLTGALCTATAARIAGSIVNECLSNSAKTGTGNIRIGHPSGSIAVDATFDAEGKVVSASVLRTARRIFEGQVFYNAQKG